MKFQKYIGFIIGISVLLVLFLHSDTSLVLKALEKVGPLSILFIALIHIFSVILCGLAWRFLFVFSKKRISILTIWARYLRDSIGNIFGFIPITGEIVAARELTFHGIKPTTSGATIVVDITAELIGQLTISIIGLILLFRIAPHSEINFWLLSTFCVASISIAFFFIAQRYGITNFIEKVLDLFNLKRSWSALPNTETIHSEIESIYSAKWRLPVSIIFHIISCIVSALETWVALYILNYNLSFSNSLALQGLVTSGRTLAFFVPWGAGIQEGGYVLIGSILGIEPYLAIALSLLKRSREIVLGIPGVLAWQALESHRLWKSGLTEASNSQY